MMAVVHDLAEAQGTIASQATTAARPLLTFARLSLSLPVGDIAPREGIPKAEKRRLEAVSSFPCPFFLRRTLTIRAPGQAQEAMQNFVHEMLHDSPAALKIMSLWQEYEDQSTAEACFVKGG